MKNPLQSLDQSTALCDLTDDQLWTLGQWQQEIHGWTECDSIKTRIGGNHDWATALGEFIRRESESAAIGVQGSVLISNVPQAEGVEQGAGLGYCATQMPWLLDPFRLISWWAMENFSADVFFGIAQMLQAMVEVLRRKGEKPLVENACAYMRKHLTGVAARCDQISLKAQARAARRFAEFIAPGVPTQVAQDRLLELAASIKDEMKEHKFLWVPPHRSEWYEKTAPQILGEDCCERFSSIQREIEEAAKCHALGRYTACAYHLMRSTEVGVKALARAIEYIPPHNQWQLVFSRLREEHAKPHGQRPTHWQNHGKFLTQAWGVLSAVNTAWRNDIAHLVDTYDEEESSNLLVVIPLFLRELAKGMDETGKLY